MIEAYDHENKNTFYISDEYVKTLMKNEKVETEDKLIELINNRYEDGEGVVSFKKF